VRLLARLGRWLARVRVVRGVREAPDGRTDNQGRAAGCCSNGDSIADEAVSRFGPVVAVTHNNISPTNYNVPIRFVPPVRD